MSEGRQEKKPLPLVPIGPSLPSLRFGASEATPVQIPKVSDTQGPTQLQEATPTLRTVVIF